MSTHDGTAPTPPKFSAALKAAREAAGVRQMDLAKALGMHRALLSDVELGKRLAFKTARALSVARHLDADVIRLVSLAAVERGFDAETLDDLDLEGLELVTDLILRLPGVPPKKRAALAKQIAALS